MAIGFAKRIILSLVGLYSVLLPVMAQLEDSGFPLFEALKDNIIIQQALPIIFLFLLLLALFMVPTQVMKNKFGFDEKIAYLIAGILAAIGTYYGVQNELLWAFWQGVFTSGIFIVAAIIMIAGIFILIGILYKGRGYAAEAGAQYAEKRKSWFEKAKGMEEQRAAYAKTRAEQAAEAEEYGASKSMALLRGAANNLARIFGRDIRFYTSAQLREMLEVQIVELQALRNQFRAEQKKFGLEAKESKIVFGDERIAVKELKQEMKTLRGNAGNVRERNIIIDVLNKMQNIIAQINVIKKQYRDADKAIAKAQAKIKAAEKLRGNEAKPRLKQAYEFYQMANASLMKIEGMLIRKKQWDKEAMMLVNEARALGIAGRRSAFQQAAAVGAGFSAKASPKQRKKAAKTMRQQGMSNVRIRQ